MYMYTQGSQFHRRNLYRYSICGGGGLCNCTFISWGTYQTNVQTWDLCGGTSQLHPGYKGASVQQKMTDSGPGQWCSVNPVSSKEWAALSVGNCPSKDLILSDASTCRHPYLILLWECFIGCVKWTVWEKISKATLLEDCTISHSFSYITHVRIFLKCAEENISAETKRMSLVCSIMRSS